MMTFVIYVPGIEYGFSSYVRLETVTESGGA